MPKNSGVGELGFLEGRLVNTDKKLLHWCACINNSEAIHIEVVHLLEIFSWQAT